MGDDTNKSPIMRLLGFLHDLIITSLVIYFLYWFFKKPGKLFWRWLLLPAIIVILYFRKLKYADSEYLYHQNGSHFDFVMSICFTVVIIGIIIIGKSISSYMDKDTKS